MKDLVTSLLFGDEEPTIIRECRQCGTEVAPQADRCPQCNADTIVTYMID